MPDVYRDTNYRYKHDAEFRAAVDTLESAARRHGFTPGELKQIAFKAALNIEEQRPLPVFIRPDGTVGHLKDGTPVYFVRRPT